MSQRKPLQSPGQSNVESQEMRFNPLQSSPLSTKKRRPLLNAQERQALALQASGEYMMNHLSDILEMAEDKHAWSKGQTLDEETLIVLEAQVKTIAETLIFQAEGQPTALEASYRH